MSDPTAIPQEPVSPLPSGEQNENPPNIGFVKLLLEDYRTHGSTPFAAGFWALAVHRLGNVRMDTRQPLRAPLTALYKLAYHGVIAMWGIDLPYNAKIGRRLRIDHHGCIHLGARAVGDDVRIRHSATVGLLRRTQRSLAPTIGNRVEIGPGACIVGGTHVGDDCYVGPNSVLAESIPAGTTVIGVPARPMDLDRYLAKD